MHGDGIGIFSNFGPVGLPGTRNPEGVINTKLAAVDETDKLAGRELNSTYVCLLLYLVVWTNATCGVSTKMDFVVAEKKGRQPTLGISKLAVVPTPIRRACKEQMA